MKIGMNLLLWTAGVEEKDLPLIENIKEWGFDGVELPMFSLDGSPWKKLGSALDGMGLGRTAVAVLPEGANLVGDEASERGAGVDFLKSCVDCCVELGAETLAGPIYSPVGRLVGRWPNDEERKRCAEGLREVGEHAKAAGVAVSVEPLNRFETYFLNTEADAAKLIDEVSLEGVGILFDTFHANIEEKDVSKAIQTAGARINHVHVSANDRGTPGEDHIDYATAFDALKAIGYDGWLTIESFGYAMPELAAATCIWRAMAPSEEHVAREGLAFIRRSWSG